MKIEVQIHFSNLDVDWEVNVNNQETGERIGDLERAFPTYTDASEYVSSLIQNKDYVVVLIKERS